MKRPKTKKEWAVYRCILTCSIGKKACENRQIPEGIDKKDWIFCHRRIGAGNKGLR